MKVTQVMVESPRKSTFASSDPHGFLGMHSSLFLLLISLSKSWRRSSAQLRFSLNMLIFCLANLPRVDADTNVIGLDSFSSYGGAYDNDASGGGVRFAGDVDGDGYVDILVGEFHASPLVDDGGGNLVQRQGAGRIRLVWGPIDSTTFFFHDFLNYTHAENIVFIGPWTGADIGETISAAGDIDNDGYADIMFSEKDGGYLGVRNSGRVYVWYGRPRAWTEAVYDMSFSLANYEMIAIDGDVDENCGFSIRHAGDTDGDGYDDILIGCREASPLNRTNAGRSYLCYGRERFDWPFNPAIGYHLPLANHSTYGCRAINGAIAYGKLGYAVAAGDVNNDTYSDAIITAADMDTASQVGAGVTYIYFGGVRENPLQDIDLLDIHNSLPGGVLINGEYSMEYSGTKLAVGDVDGDGIKDVLIASNYAEVNSNLQAGLIRVYYGKNNWVHIIDPKNEVFRLTLISDQAFAMCGYSLAVGNFNDDQCADILVGCFGYSPPGVGGIAGRSYVYAGRPRNNSFAVTIDLANKIDSNDTLIFDGEGGGDSSGISLDSGYDIDSDGRDDALIGAYHAPTLSRPESGKTYFIPSDFFSSRLKTFGPIIPQSTSLSAMSNNTVSMSSWSLGSVFSQNQLTTLDEVGMTSPSSSNSSLPGNHGSGASSMSLALSMTIVGGLFGSIFIMLIVAYWYKMRKEPSMAGGARTPEWNTVLDEGVHSGGSNEVQNSTTPRVRATSRSRGHSSLVVPNNKHLHSSEKYNKRRSSSLVKNQQEPISNYADISSYLVTEGSSPSGQSTVEELRRRQGYMSAPVGGQPKQEILGYGILPWESARGPERRSKRKSGEYENVSRVERGFPPYALSPPGYDRVNFPKNHPMHHYDEATSSLK